MAEVGSKARDRARRQMYRMLVPGVWHPTKISPINRMLIILILVSITFVVLESEETLATSFPKVFQIGEWVLGGIFVVEYCVRIWVSVDDSKFGGGWKARARYVVSPTALFDLLAILPLFLSFLGTEAFLFRLLRLVRILRMSKLGRYSKAASAIGQAIHSRRFELGVSLGIGLGLMLISATFLYVAEGGAQPENFGSIPRAMWWSIATLTTVGYGDAYPITVVGKLFAGATAIIGIGLVAMPAGILAAAFGDVLARQRKETEQAQTRDDIDQPGRS